MRIITIKELRYSANLVAQGKLDEEERMVVSSQLKQAANLIELLESNQFYKPTDSDIEAWANKEALIKTNIFGGKIMDNNRKWDYIYAIKAVLTGEIKHVK